MSEVNLNLTKWDYVGLSRILDPRDGEERNGSSLQSWQAVLTHNAQRNLDAILPRQELVELGEQIVSRSSNDHFDTDDENALYLIGHNAALTMVVELGLNEDLQSIASDGRIEDREFWTLHTDTTPILGQFTTVLQD